MVNPISNVGLPALPLPAPVYPRAEVTAVAEVKEVTSAEGRETTKVAVSKKQASTESKNTAPAEEEKGAGVRMTPLSIEDLEGNVESANKLMEYMNRRINFTIDDKIERIVVKIVDGETNEVIRQIPPEEMVAMMRRLKDLVDGFKGLLYSHRG